MTEQYLFPVDHIELVPELFDSETRVFFRRATQAEFDLSIRAPEIDPLGFGQIEIGGKIYYVV